MAVRRPSQGRAGRQTLATCRREADATFDLLADVLPEIAPLDDAGLLTWLHACVSPNPHPVRPPETPVFLDVWLADAGLTGAQSLDDMADAAHRRLPPLDRPVSPAA